MHYRAEIDGLRALAVLPVILFHAGFTAFSGGFVGVDIFFVVSGYLITRIIVGEMTAGKFTLLHFYERRARRILPALFAVMLACIPVAWLLMLPEDLENFGQSLVATTLFSNNILLYLTTSYWDSAAELKPLLHSWSLAVEEQYYILFPLFLMMIWRFGARWLLIGSAALMIAGFSLAIASVDRYPAAAFYLLPTRGWEILIGAVVALHWPGDKAISPRAFFGQSLSLIGFLLIMFAVFTFDANTPFPSLYTLVPTVGTALILIYAQPGTLVHRLLSLPWLVGMGLISYSAYLWHQPIFAFIRYRSLEELPDATLAGLIILSFALAYISWRFIERPFRNHEQISARQILTTAVVVGGLIVGLGMSAAMTQGFNSHYQQYRTGPLQKTLLDSLALDQSRAKCDAGYDNSGWTLEPCRFGPPDAPIALAIIGDSQSAMILPPLIAMANERNQQIAHYGHAGCPSLLGIYVQKGFVETGACADLAQRQLEYVKAEQIPVVLMVVRWSLYVHPIVNGKAKSSYYLSTDKDGPASLVESRKAFERGLADTIKAYAAIGTQLVIAEQIPEQLITPKSLLRFASPRRFEDAVQSYSVNRQRHDRMQDYADDILTRTVPGLGGELISFDDRLCDQTRCWIAEGERFLYWDTDHLTIDGAQKLRPALVNMFGLPDR